MVSWTRATVVGEIEHGESSQWVVEERVGIAVELYLGGGK